MNKLAILGNGFDLAHRMKTSYRDFLIDYLRKIMEESSSTATQYDDSLKNIKKHVRIIS